MRCPSKTFNYCRYMTIKYKLFKCVKEIHVYNINNWTPVYKKLRKLYRIDTKVSRQSRKLNKFDKHELISEKNCRKLQYINMFVYKKIFKRPNEAKALDTLWTDTTYIEYSFPAKTNDAIVYTHTTFKSSRHINL